MKSKLLNHPSLLLFLVLISCKLTFNKSSEFAFPTHWVGQWKGNLQIFDTKGIQQAIPMELRIDTLTNSKKIQWTIIYEPERKSGGRQYVLEPTASKNVFILNENNGILLKNYLFGNTMISRFAVMGNLLECKTTLLNTNEMLYEISSGKVIASDTTGNRILEKDTIPAVYNYRVGYFQRAVLKKVK